MSEPYNHKAIEKKWQEYWKEHETFKTDVWDFSKPYILAFFSFLIRYLLQYILQDVLQISCRV